MVKTFTAFYILLYYIGFHVNEDQLAEVAKHSEVLDVDTDFLSPEMRAQCEAIIPYPEKVEPSDCAKAFVYLKGRYSEENPDHI